jgi:WD40 repeat protein
VRTLSVTPSSSIISGSRDASAIVWRSGDGNTYTASRTIANPDGKFVASVGWLEHDGVGEVSLPSHMQVRPLSVHSTTVYIALGSQSSVISLWRADDENATGPAFTLVGHKQNVCCLDSNSGTLISGSWDK